MDVLRHSFLQLAEHPKRFCARRLDIIQNIKWVGPNNELPVFEVHDLHVTEETKDRCILLYGSHNGPYSSKVRTLLEELEQCGYSGHVLLRIGGFPNVSAGGLKLCHIPYSFKVAFLREATLLGYKKILWLDTALHPLTDLEGIFSQIEKRGYYFTETGMLSRNHEYHLEEASLSLDIPLQLHNQIPHISAALIGLNMDCPEVVQFLDSWYEVTERLTPNINWLPEELSLSVMAWRSNFAPSASFSNIICHQVNVFSLYFLLQPEQRRFPDLQFYLDLIR